MKFGNGTEAPKLSQFTGIPGISVKLLGYSRPKAIPNNSIWEVVRSKQPLKTQLCKDTKLSKEIYISSHWPSP